MKKSSVMVVVMAVLAALVLSACYHRTPEQRAEYLVKRMSTELSLTDVQKAQLEKIKNEFLARRAEMPKLREETVKEANELMRSAEIDKTRLNALTEKNQTQMNDMISFVTAKFTEIHDMLTPDQREKLVKHVEEHMRNKHHR
jgi:Spy/CpxP family protein refolding chaperone